MAFRVHNSMHTVLVYIPHVSISFFFSFILICCDGVSEGPGLGSSWFWLPYRLSIEEFVPVANFSTSAWSITEERAPCLTARRAMRDE